MTSLLASSKRDEVSAHRATLVAGAPKSEAAGADGNRGTAVPPFPQRYDCYRIEKNNGRTSERVRLVATLAPKTKVLRPPLAAEYAPF